MTALLQRLFGDRIADELRAPFVLGDTTALRNLFSEAGIPRTDIRTLDGTARFPSLQSWLHTDIKGWTLAEKIDEIQYQTLLREAGSALRSYVRPDGTVTFAAPAHIATVAKS
jgi:hypothetical protein